MGAIGFVVVGGDETTGVVTDEESKEDGIFGLLVNVEFCCSNFVNPSRSTIFILIYLLHTLFISEADGS